MSLSTVHPETTLSDRRITLRFKSEEWRIIEADIKASGCSVSEYFRQLALEAPAPRKARRKYQGEQAVIYAKWLGALGKIGSNLNQIARHLNTAAKTGDPTQRPSNKEVLDAMKDVRFVLQKVLVEVRDIGNSTKA